jgi:preprotein translocase subunit SecG
MGVVEIILGILILLAAVAIIVAVVLQEGHDEGLGSIAGGNSETSFFKGSDRSYEDILSRGTKILGIVFAALIMLVNIVAFFM